MPFSSEDELIAATSSAYTHTFAPMTTGYALAQDRSAMPLQSSWITSHRKGAVPASLRVPELCTRTTVGAAPLPAPAAGKQWYASAMTFAMSTAQFVMVIDRLSQVRIDPNITTAQSVNLSRPARAATGAAVMAFFELVAHVGGSNTTLPSQINFGYTNSAGQSGRTGTAFIAGGAVATHGPIVGGMVAGNLAEGDRGVSSIQSVTMPVAWPAAYQVLVSLGRVVYHHVGAAQTATVAAQAGFHDIGGTPLGADPCLYYATPTSSSAFFPSPVITGRFIQG